MTDSKMTDNDKMLKLCDIIENLPPGPEKLEKAKVLWDSLDNQDARALFLKLISMRKRERFSLIEGKWKK